MSRISQFILLSTLFSFFLLPLPSFAYTFTRNLSVGTGGYDVFLLQKVLNSNPATQITSSGVGSPGNESSYFGTLTKNAVISFQQLYKNDVLTPVGLISGTGFVGALTRQKLNSLALSATATTTPNLSPYLGVIDASLAFPTGGFKQVFLFGLSGFLIKPGDPLTIQGLNFAATNTVSFQSFTASTTIVNIPNIVSTSSTGISLPVPALAKGVYGVWVSNSLGTTQKIAKVFIKVSDQTIARPHLTSVLPIQVTASSTITITGTGFDSLKNIIYSTLGILKNVPSQGGTSITFKVASLPNIAEFEAGTTASTPLDFTFTIGTPNGNTDNYGDITITP
jgi:hypothetical protein